jgi:hypothetical protein
MKDNKVEVIIMNNIQKIIKTGYSPIRKGV